ASGAALQTTEEKGSVDGGCERRTWRLLLHTVARLRRRQNKTRKRCRSGPGSGGRATGGLAVQIWTAADLDVYGCFAN
ncbi:hypothetical protein Csa_018891, partial [Cucumis sativus]